MKTSHASLPSNALRKVGIVALGCAAFALIGPRAQAEEPVQIVISAPSTKIVGHYPDLTPIEQVTVSAKVLFNPSYLRTSAGIDLLKERVLKAARNICWSTDFDADDSNQECVSRAVQGADAQIQAAVKRAQAGDPVAKR
jgi:UrcA family protein